MFTNRLSQHLPSLQYLLRKDMHWQDQLHISTKLVSDSHFTEWCTAQNNVTSWTGASLCSALQQECTTLHCEIGLIEEEITAFFLKLIEEKNVKTPAALLLALQRLNVWLSLRQSSTYLAFFLLLLLPCVTALFSIVFGGILALTQGWTYSESFVVLACEISRCSATLVQPSSPLSFWRKSSACLVGLLVRGMYAIIVAIMSGPLVTPIARLLKLTVTTEDSIKTGVQKVAILLTMVFTTSATAISALTGGMLFVAAGGEITFEQAFFVILSGISGKYIDVTSDIPKIDTTAGTIAVLFTSAWSMGFYFLVFAILVCITDTWKGRLKKSLYEGKVPKLQGAPPQRPVQLGWGA
jgi:hypothetical protein